MVFIHCMLALGLKQIVDQLIDKKVIANYFDNSSIVKVLIKQEYKSLSSSILSNVRCAGLVCFVLFQTEYLQVLDCW